MRIAVQAALSAVTRLQQVVPEAAHPCLAAGRLLRLVCRVLCRRVDALLHERHADQARRRRHLHRRVEDAVAMTDEREARP